MGVTSVWDTLTSTLFKTDEDGLDLGYSKHYSVAMPAYLSSGAPLRNFKFKTNSSHTTTPGLDCVASKELLSKINSSVPLPLMPTRKKFFLKHRPSMIVLFQTKLSLYLAAATCLVLYRNWKNSDFASFADHTFPGWVPNPGNLAKLSEHTATAEPDDVVVVDLLGNVTHRFAQVDGTLAMPFKSDGKYHYEGDIKVCTYANLKTLIESMKQALLKCRCHLVFMPPLPIHLYDKCCPSLDHCTNIGSEKHAENMLGKLNAIRTACLSILETIGLKNFSVPDIIKLSLPACVGLPEYAAALKVLMKDDGIHFKASRHICIAAEWSAHLSTLKPYNSGKKSAAVFPISGVKSSRKQSFYWRGFVSRRWTTFQSQGGISAKPSHPKCRKRRGGVNGRSIPVRKTPTSRLTTEPPMGSPEGESVKKRKYKRKNQGTLFFPLSVILLFLNPVQKMHIPVF
jgi:hypothetical protein